MKNTGLYFCLNTVIYDGLELVYFSIPKNYSKLIQISKMERLLKIFFKTFFKNLSIIVVLQGSIYAYVFSLSSGVYR